MSAVVFLGPTLPLAEADGLLTATYLPPARQGDLYRAVSALRPAAVGLVDGRFLDTGAVWHREILWALSQGVHVFGASSMGALRAAELAPFGMRGVGAVFAAYRDGLWPGDDAPFEDDDEVAVIHAPVEMGGLALSDAMVDLRATLDTAETAGVVTTSEHQVLVKALKGYPFAERTFGRLADEATSRLGPVAAERFATWLPRNKVPRKRLDAIEMLMQMSAFLATSPAPFTADFVMQQPVFWRRFVSQSDAALDPPAQVVLDKLKRDPDAWRACARAALGRAPSFTADASASAGTPHRALDRFRRDRGLWRRSDLLAWMQANALDETGLERLLRREDEIDRVAAEAPPWLIRAMADHLRLTGAFSGMLGDGGGDPT